MDCKKVRDMILTDYLDNVLDPQQTLGIDRHLKDCFSCREVLGTVRAGLLKNVREIAPDPAVWHKIREKIEDTESRRTRWLEKVGEILAPLLTMPRLALGASFVTALVLITVLFLKAPSGDVGPAYAYLAEQVALMDDLRSGGTGLLTGELNGYASILDE